MNAWKNKFADSIEVIRQCTTTWKSRDKKYTNIKYCALHSNLHNCPNTIDEDHNINMTTASRYSFSNAEDCTEVSFFYSVVRICTST